MKAGCDSRLLLLVGPSISECWRLCHFPDNHFKCIPCTKYLWHLAQYRAEVSPSATSGNENSTRLGIPTFSRQNKPAQRVQNEPLKQNRMSSMPGTFPLKTWKCFFGCLVSFSAWVGARKRFMRDSAADLPPMRNDAPGAAWLSASKRGWAPLTTRDTPARV